MCMSFRTYRRDVHPFETDTKGRLLGVDVSINWPRKRHWLTKVLDSWKATQQNLLRQRYVKVPVADYVDIWVDVFRHVYLLPQWQVKFAIFTSYGALTAAGQAPDPKTTGM